MIEDAPVELLRSVLVLRESESEPALQIPQLQDDHEFRRALIESVSEVDQEDLRPLEQRASRIRRLAEGKGTSSLDLVVGRQLNAEQNEEYQNQLDPLCRSIWTYINFRGAFEDAESFYFARQFRDYGKLYDAFEIELDHVLPLTAGSVEKEALAGRLSEFLDLKTSCTVRAVDLPESASHSPSILLIVRHGGPLSSVFDHRNDGQRRTIYFRPSNEAILIYTPALRLVEICADSPFVRQKVGACFAEVVLRQDVSKKPLTWRYYDLSRFRTSLTLPTPAIDGLELLEASVLEIELRLGNWKRRLSLKVAFEDNIDAVARHYLGESNIIRRADGFSRVGIAVRYRPLGEDHERSLNITISGNRCNLQSNKDPAQRALGYGLLKEWGIMSPFREIETPELLTILPQLIQLFDRGEDEVTGSYLRSIGLDPKRLIEGGLLERRGRQDVVLSEDQEAEGEASVEGSATPGMVKLTGLFGENLGEHPAPDLSIYRLKPEWLHETLVGLLKPLLSNRAAQVLNANLTILGSTQIDDGQVPVYFAKRLDDLKTINTLDLILRGRSSIGFGIVLSATTDGLPACLGANVVIPLVSLLDDQKDPDISRADLELAFRSGRNAAMGISAPVLHRYAGQSATLYVPGKAPLSLVGANQIILFARLVDAYLAGSPDVKSGTLTEGMSSKSPQQCFRPETWKTILNIYIIHGVKWGYWRLAV